MNSHDRIYEGVGFVFGFIPNEDAQIVADARQEKLPPEAFLKKLVTDHLPVNVGKTFAEILAPVHAYSQAQGYTEEEIGDFVDAEIAAYRTERRAKQEANPRD